MTLQKTLWRPRVEQMEMLPPRSGCWSLCSGNAWSSVSTAGTRWHAEPVYRKIKIKENIAIVNKKQTNTKEATLYSS